ncbi:MAG: hypothetical protein ABI456_08310, partial [Ktedonobacteraceae bacterium]
RGRTTFVVASRLRTIKSAQQILVLEKGAIVERGTHETLLARNGSYARLYDLQLREQEEFEARLLSYQSQPQNGSHNGHHQQGQREGERASDNEEKREVLR